MLFFVFCWLVDDFNVLFLVFVVLYVLVICDCWCSLSPYLFGDLRVFRLCFRCLYVFGDLRFSGFVVGVRCPTKKKREKKVVLAIYDFPIFVFGVRSLLVICDVVFHVVFLVVCNFHVLLMVFVVFILLGIYDFHVSFWCSL